MIFFVNKNFPRVVRGEAMFRYVVLTKHLTKNILATKVLCIGTNSHIGRDLQGTIQAILECLY